MPPMIEVRDLVKTFGPFTAVDGLDLVVPKGEVLGFLGPNGAGKSTTMKMITGFMTPTAGTIAVAGHDMLADPIAGKRTIGYLPEGAPAYPDMTPVGFLEFCARARGMSRTQARAKVAEAIERVDLRGVTERPIENLSKGYKRRVGLAQAILHDPDVLILDEPTDGLDPNQKQHVRELIAEMAKDKAIVISTHILEEVDAVCTRAVIIARGRIVADGTPADLAARSRHHGAASLTVPDAVAADIADALGGLVGVATVEGAVTAGGTVLTVFPEDGVADLSGRVAQAAQSEGWPMVSLVAEGGRLDDVFRAVTTKTGEAAR